MEDGPVKLNSIVNDADGNPIQCHGGNMIQIKKMLWWYGEGEKNAHGNSKCVNAYSAPSVAG